MNNLNNIELPNITIEIKTETSLVRVRSAQSHGLDIEDITIEALKSPGPRQLLLTGMADSTLKDAKEKIMSALVLSGWSPTEKLLVNLLPPETDKVGAHHELPVLLACRAALESEPTATFLSKIKSYRVVGSLSLSGDLLSTPLTQFMERSDPQQTLGPSRFKNFDQLWNFLNSENIELPPIENSDESQKKISTNDPIQVHGRTWERFWIMAAFVAEKHVFMIGPPGVGKTYLATWAHQLAPNPIEPGLITKIWALAEHHEPSGVPLLRPHSRTHLSEFIGFQRNGLSRPGIFTLAHQGVLIMDEFAELNRDCRETLRTVLDQKIVFRNTSRGTLSWPAQFWMIATCNPCPCGYRQGSDLSHCRCSETQRRSYFSRLSGPLLERMGLKLPLAREEFEWRHEHFALPDIFKENTQQLASRLIELRKQMSIHTNEAKSLIENDTFFVSFSAREKQNLIDLLCAAKLLSPRPIHEVLFLMKLLKKAEHSWLPF